MIQLWNKGDEYHMLKERVEEIWCSQDENGNWF